MESRKPSKRQTKSLSVMVNIFLTDETHMWLVRTTSVANLDSRLLVTTSDLAKLKARNMTLGDAAFNVDEYIARLVAFMGGRHQLPGRLNDPRERDDNMDWALLGQTATEISRRPPTLGFMLGPLSVEKKERKVTRRQVERRDNAEIVRPQQVSPLFHTAY
jgi:non-structural maintenance of chromosomes element 4